jgi:acyl-coenzyme A synthetase/AMP-(fatty) acid ligase
VLKLNARLECRSTEEGVTNSVINHSPWLWGVITAAGSAPDGTIYGAAARVALSDLDRASYLGGHLEQLRGRTVLIATREQLSAALALVELDGVARRLVLCTPDLASEHFPHVIAQAGADAWVRDAGSPQSCGVAMASTVTVTTAPASTQLKRRRSHETQWVLLTSGTTGAPKLVLHTLASLTSVLTRRPPQRGSAVWSTFYDIRRYGGLQIFLRAMHTGSLVLSAPQEPVGDFFARASAAGVTHISGTPSQWRRALMSGAAAALAPTYVRLSGEIADQAILDALRAAYPNACIAHAFASTEAGVAFEVGDGLAGIPASLVGAAGGDVQLRVMADTLQIRSPGNAVRYLGGEAAALRRADGFVDTGDRVELRGERYHFVGRAGGVINVGGLKVHPEEVEAVINSHPWVRMSLARARRNPITGAVVTADVVLAEHINGAHERPATDTLTQELLETCRRALPAHKVPTVIRIVPALEVSPSGKLVRPNA